MHALLAVDQATVKEQNEPQKSLSVSVVYILPRPPVRCREIRNLRCAEIAGGDLSVDFCIDQNGVSST